MGRLKDSYWNPFSESERREEVQRDHRDTYHSRAQSALDDEAGGRFSKVTSNKLTGAEPVRYPAVPSGPWSEGDLGAPDPATDQFGDVNEMEPTGSHVEIERSLQRRDADGASSPFVEHASESPTKDGIAGLRGGIVILLRSLPAHLGGASNAITRNH
jgi:hypothetical protein